MLNTASPLNRSPLSSALAGTSRIRPNGGRVRRQTFVGLMLTSLVDAFSILVIFLIMNAGASQETLNVSDKVQLPQAKESGLLQTGVVIRVEAGQFLIDDRPVQLGALAAHLKALHGSADAAKKEGIIIVADRKLDYADLSPVILAGSSAGFTKFKFAVVRED